MPTHKIAKLVLGAFVVIPLLPKAFAGGVEYRHMRKGDYYPCAAVIAGTNDIIRFADDDSLCTDAVTTRWERDYDREENLESYGGAFFTCYEVLNDKDVDTMYARRVRALWDLSCQRPGNFTFRWKRDYRREENFEMGPLYSCYKVINDRFVDTSTASRIRVVDDRLCADAPRG